MSKLKIDDSIGVKYHNLEIVEKVLSKDYGLCSRNKHAYVCKCVCGRQKIVKGNHLGLIKSCGCALKTRKTRSNRGFGVSTWHMIFAKLKYGCARKRREFAITESQYVAFCLKNCSYCGIEPHMQNDYYGLFGHIVRNGIDRVDSLKGYTLENCVPCCFMCNRAKGDFTREQFVDIVGKIYRLRCQDQSL